MDSYLATDDYEVMRQLKRAAKRQQKGKRNFEEQIERVVKKPRQKKLNILDYIDQDSSNDSEWDYSEG